MQRARIKILKPQGEAENVQEATGKMLVMGKASEHLTFHN